MQRNDLEINKIFNNPKEQEVHALPSTNTRILNYNRKLT